MVKSLTVSEQDISLKKLKVKKSLGPDHISLEMLTKTHCLIFSIRAGEKETFRRYGRRQSRHQS